MTRGIGWGTAVVLAVALVLPATALAQPVEQPGMGIRLLEAPTGLLRDPRALLYVVDHVAPGTRIQRRFEVSNGDPEAFTADLYAVGATITDDAFVGDPGRGRNDLASWIRVDPGTVDVEPGARVAATMRIDVPVDAPEGEHYAVVFAERVTPGAGGGMAVTTRVGLRIYLSVGEGGAPAADFEITSFTAGRARSGEPTLHADVTNTGGRALDLEGEVALDEGPGTLSAGPFPAVTGTTVPPGGRAMVEVLLDPALPIGPWHARLVLRSGRIERTAEAVLSFPEVAGEAVAVPATGPRDPWLLLPGSIAVTSASVAAVLLRRRRRAAAATLQVVVGPPLAPDGSSASATATVVTAVPPPPPASPRPPSRRDAGR